MEVEERFLQGLARSPEYVGVARLGINQCFAPERVVTLIFMTDGIAVDVSGPKEQVSEAGKVHYDNAPEWVRSWEGFRLFVSSLGPCENLGVYDGTAYTHAICDSGNVKLVAWTNPSWLKHPRQMTVIRGYVELAESAGLTRLIRMWRG